MSAQKAIVAVILFLFRVLVVLLVIMGIFRLGEYAYAYGYSIVSDAAMEPAPGRDIEVVLTDDMDTKEVAELLERRGLIEDQMIFRIQLKINKLEEDMKPGNYVLNTSMTPEEIMLALSGEAEEEEE